LPAAKPRGDVMTNRIMLGIDKEKFDDDIGEGGDDEGDDFDGAGGDDDEW